MSQTILAFGSHPDDIEIGCAGTLALHIARGARVVHVCMTSGEAGKQSMDPKDLARIREEEAREAARRLGSAEVRFLRYPDGEVTVQRAWKVRVIDLVREIRPDMVFTHSPTDLFADHRLFGKLILDGIRAASGPWYPDSPRKPHRVPHVFGYEVWHPIPEPQCFVDVTSTWDKKARALQAFTSQIDEIAYDEAFHGLARYRGVMSGAGRYAEAFDVLTLGAIP